ncbi:MAG TPA: recombinase A [Byssovorax sp.]|jgi:recombination protein RecA
MSSVALLRSLLPASIAGNSVALGADVAAQGALRARALPLDFHGVDALLPDGGVPRGAVVELASPGGLARATTLALAVCAAAQREATARGGAASAGAWCAWIEGAGSLFAPAAARAGVDLARLLVVRPPRADEGRGASERPRDLLGRVAVRVASSRVFSIVVVDAAGVPGALARERLDRWSTAVRRLALAVEGSDTSVLLLTDSRARRSLPLPVAMRIELERPAFDRVALRIAKERGGRVSTSSALAIPA